MTGLKNLKGFGTLDLIRFAEAKGFDLSKSPLEDTKTILDLDLGSDIGEDVLRFYDLFPPDEWATEKGYERFAPDISGETLRDEMKRTGAPDVLIGVGVYVHDDRYYRDFGKRVTQNFPIPLEWSFADPFDHTDNEREYLDRAKASGNDVPAIIVERFETEGSTPSPFGVVTVTGFPSNGNEMGTIPISFSVGDRTYRTRAEVALGEKGYSIFANPIYIQGEKFVPEISSVLAGRTLGDNRVISGDKIVITYKTKPLIGDDLAVHLDVPEIAGTDTVRYSPVQEVVYFEIRTPELLAKLSHGQKWLALLILRLNSGEHVLLGLPNSNKNSAAHHTLSVAFGQHRLGITGPTTAAQIKAAKESGFNSEFLTTFYAKAMNGGVVGFGFPETHDYRLDLLFQLTGLIIPTKEGGFPPLKNIREEHWQNSVPRLRASEEALAALYLLGVIDEESRVALGKTESTAAILYLEKIGIRTVRDFAKMDTPEKIRLKDAITTILAIRDIKTNDSGILEFPEFGSYVVKLNVKLSPILDTEVTPEKPAIKNPASKETIDAMSESALQTIIQITEDAIRTTSTSKDSAIGHINANLKNIDAKIKALEEALENFEDKNYLVPRIQALKEARDRLKRIATLFNAEELAPADFAHTLGRFISDTERIFD